MCKQKMVFGSLLSTEFLNRSNACLSVAVYIVLLEGSRLSELIDQLPFGSITKLNMHALLALKSSLEIAIVYDSQVPTSIVKVVQPPEQA